MTSAIPDNACIDRSWSLGILVGGRSRRMGRDKALMPFGGERLLDRVANRAGGGRDVYFAVGDASRVATLGLDASVCVFDRRPGDGPLGGIAALAARARTPWVAIVGCDMPFTEAAALDLLAAEAARDRADVAFFLRSGRLESLPVVVRTAVASKIDAVASRGAGPILDLRTVGRTLALDVSSVLDAASVDRVFQNLNTPEDFDRALGESERTSTPNHPRSPLG